MVIARIDPLTGIQQLAQACQEENAVVVCHEISDGGMDVEFSDGVPLKATVGDDGIAIAFRPLEPGDPFVIPLASMLLLAISSERCPGEPAGEPETFASALAALAA
jgi:hypothetical protein